MKNTEEPLKRKKEEKIIMSEIRKLNCGLRVVLEQIPYLQSVTAGVWVKAGCVDESDGETGISHFIEHMMFKGTAKRTARQIASDADALGAQMNAFTSKESTCYYIKSLTSNVDKACEIIIDMLTGSLFDPAEMAKEKQVVKEEIKMVEDAPEDDVQDMLYEELFKGGPLSKSILGTPESLDAITHDDIKNYIAREYTLDNIVVSVAGNFDADQICQQFEHSLSCMTASKEIIETFINETQKNKDRITTAYSQKNVNEISTVAHKMLPVITMIGIPEMQKILLSLERLKNNTFNEDIDKQTTHLLHLIDNLINNITKYKKQNYC